ncbi:MAG: CDP-glucose 4,6-dehydratase [Desulfobacterales bacterium]|nr:CDP-glucose 4,6-dehydratase [Desulfobacterales bacterium]
MDNNFHGVFKGIPVLVTGHTGFKGSWLSIWLKELGAEVIGYSLEPPSAPSNFGVSRLADRLIDIRGDVRDLPALQEAVEKHQPKVIFHLAAQAIVRESYADPKSTFDTNVGGTVNILEAIRRTNSVRAAVLITTDKCYENKEWLYGYREVDRLGGRDPYSASKAGAELAISAYRRSFFPRDAHEKHGVAAASTRAGNVIGGGDWGADRILTDGVRALMENRTIQVRSPGSVRPWQFVLEPLSGYLWLAARLLTRGCEFAEAWNFGPAERRAVSVREVVEMLVKLWGSGAWKDVGGQSAPHEAGLLRLSWEKAANRLGWKPVYKWPEALSETVDWFKTHHSHHSDDSDDSDDSDADMYGVCVRQIERYTSRAREEGLAWAKIASR